MERGYVFNIQRFSSHDGPGIRTTVFLKGCPLSCGWCHNPEGIAPGPELAVRQWCIECGECVVGLPRGGGDNAGAGSVPPRAASARSAARAWRPAPPGEANRRTEDDCPEVIAEIVKDRMFFEESGGGVTFSGGEPLWQPDFLRHLLEASRAKGIHTVVDTCGLVPWDDLESVAAVTDLFLFDIKRMDGETPRRAHRCRQRADPE